MIQFIEQAFGGKVVDRCDGPGDAVMHAEVMIGDSVVTLGEAMPGEVDEVSKRALEFGAKSVQGPADQSYGYRSARIEDVGRNQWTNCAIVEEVPQEEMHRPPPSELEPRARELRLWIELVDENPREDTEPCPLTSGRPSKHWTMVLDHGSLMTMRSMAISKFKATCLATLARVRRTGRPLRITRFGRPVADIVPPAPEPASGEWMGRLRGTIAIRGDIVKSDPLARWEAGE